MSAYARRVVQHQSRVLEEGYAPSFVGTQFTSWNFFAWTTSVSGNVAKRACLSRTHAHHHQPFVNA